MKENIPEDFENKRYIGLLIKFINHSIERHLNSGVEELGLTSSQCNILRFLHKQQEKEVFSVDIERDMNMSRPTITGLLQRLEEKGFIELLSNSKDKRYKRIVQTQKAEALHLAMEEKINEMTEKLLEGIPPEDVERTIEILRQMLFNMSKKEAVRQEETET